jgi:hypothetical protein
VERIDKAVRCIGDVRLPLKSKIVGIRGGAEIATQNVDHRTLGRNDAGSHIYGGTAQCLGRTNISWIERHDDVVDDGTLKDVQEDERKRGKVRGRRRRVNKKEVSNKRKNKNKYKERTRNKKKLTW